MGQKYCEDHSTLGNCTSRKPEEYVSPTLTLTHTHTPSPSLFSFLTMCNNMKQHAPQLFSFQTQHTCPSWSEPRARNVRVMPLCWDSHWVCKAYFFKGSVHKPLNLSWSVIRGKWHTVCKETNGTEHLVKAHLRELHWIGPIVFEMQLEQHAFYIILQSVWVSKISMQCIILYEKFTITVWKMVWIR